jgi:hypothetical protein
LIRKRRASNSSRQDRCICELPERAIGNFRNPFVLPRTTTMASSSFDAGH